MKQAIFLLLSSCCILFCNAQAGVKIIELPLKSTDPSGSFLPISDGGVTKRLNVNMMGVWDTYVRNDSLFKMRFNTETFITKVRDGNIVTLAATRSLTGNANVVEILHGLGGTPQNVIVKVSVPSGDASDFSNFITKVDATRVYIIYSAGPIGSNITYSLTLTKPAL